MIIYPLSLKKTFAEGEEGVPAKLTIMLCRTLRLGIMSFILRPSRIHTPTPLSKFFLNNEGYIQVQKFYSASPQNRRFWWIFSSRDRAFSSSFMSFYEFRFCTRILKTGTSTSTMSWGSRRISGSTHLRCCLGNRDDLWNQRLADPEEVSRPQKIRGDDRNESTRPAESHQTRRLQARQHSPDHQGKVYKS